LRELAIAQHDDAGAVDRVDAGDLAADLAALLGVGEFLPANEFLRRLRRGEAGRIT